MSNGISILFTIVGAFSIFVISKYNRWHYKYQSLPNVPLTFSKNPLIYWFFPLCFFLITLIFGEISFIVLLLAYGIPMVLGQYVVKRQFINQMTEHIVKEEGKSFDEARTRAIVIERGLKQMRKFL